jgi:hypothetical protein
MSEHANAYSGPAIVIRRVTTHLHYVPRAAPALARVSCAGRFFDGWLPISPDAEQWARLWNEVKEIAGTAGRDPNALTGAMYLTVITDEDRTRANERLYLEQYYGQCAAVMRSRQACYAGPNGGPGRMVARLCTSRHHPSCAALCRRPRAASGNRGGAAEQAHLLMVALQYRAKRSGAIFVILAARPTTWKRCRVEASESASCSSAVLPAAKASAGWSEFACLPLSTPALPRCARLWIAVSVLTAWWRHYNSATVVRDVTATGGGSSKAHRCLSHACTVTPGSW